MNSYQTRALEGASAVELTVALYDGIIRFMYRAISAVERGNQDQRRAAVKRAMDIVIHLQATLNMDIGGKPAEALSEFYTAMFALMLQASQANSSAKLTDGSAKLRTAASGTVSRSNCFWKLNVTEKLSLPISRSIEPF